VIQKVVKKKDLESHDEIQLSKLVKRELVADKVFPHLLLSASYHNPIFCLRRDFISLSTDTTG